MKNNFFVHVEDNKKSKPRPHEEIAARIIARYFQSNVVFLRRLESKSPDLFVLKTNVRWELKSPIGNFKNKRVYKHRAYKGKTNHGHQEK